MQEAQSGSDGLLMNNEEKSKFCRTYVFPMPMNLKMLSPF